MTSDDPAPGPPTTGPSARSQQSVPAARTRCPGVGRRAAGAEADVDRPVASDRWRSVPGRATRGVEAPARRKLVASADRIAQREQRTAVQPDVGGPIRRNSRRALNVRVAEDRIRDVNRGRVEVRNRIGWRGPMCGLRPVCWASIWYIGRPMGNGRSSAPDRSPGDRRSPSPGTGNRAPPVLCGA